MVRVKIDHIYRIYENKIKEHLSLVNDIINYREFRGGRYRPIFKQKVYLIVELSFLKIFMSWEDFLERTFIRYMCGGHTNSDYAPKRYIQPINLDHALNILRQARRFIDWTRGNEIIHRSKLFFQDGEPYATTIGASLQQLDEMKVIRNKIAHQSKYATRNFQQLVRNKYGYYPKGITAGKLLISNIPSTNPKTVLKEYYDLLLTLGKMIVP